MKKNTRRQHHRSLKRKINSHRIVHTNIRSWHTISASFTNDNTLDRKKNLRTLSTNLNFFNSTYHLPDVIQNAKDIKTERVSHPDRRNPANSSIVNDRSQTLSSERNQRDKISLQTEILNRQSRTISDRKEESMDRIGIIEDHHRKSNKRKKMKCSPLCITASVLIGALLVISFATAIAVIIIKLRTTKSNLLTGTNYTLRWNTTGEIVAGVTGQNGSAANQLYFPFDLFVDSSNTLYITDGSNNRVQRWTSDASTGTTVCGEADGMWGTNTSDLHLPAGILLDSNSNIYVADGGNSRIQYWPAGASSGLTVAGNGSAGNTSSQLNNAYGITLDSSSGTLYIADYANHRVMSYVSGASSGTLIVGNGSSGIDTTQLSYPTTLYFDSPSNSLVITNIGSNNIVRWTIGASSWTLVGGSINGSSGNTSMLLNHPVGMKVDPMGNVYVADRLNNRVQLFLVGTSEAITIAGVTGASGSNSTLLYRPYSLALDNQLNLYVTDTYNHRVQRFLRY